MRGDGSQIAFVENLIPALESGDYTVTVQQAVTLGSTLTETFTNQQSLSVVGGPRYSLPPSAIDSVFPPAGHQGEFSNVLAHVVLSPPTLPWQRDVEPPGGAEPAGARPTWLAVLLFDQDDPPPSPQSSTLASLVTGDGVLFPSRTPESGEQGTDPVTTIDVPLTLFNEVAPSVADLQWLAHVRQVSPGADGSAQSDYAVVFGNRLPVGGSVSTAHLVSLEGYADYLPAQDGTPSTAFPAGTTAVRLVTLKTWIFTAVDLKETFDEMLTPPHLDISPPVLQLPYTDPPAGPTDADTAVKDAFGIGYTGLDHGLQNGDATVSWYRGPLLPLGVPADKDATPPYANADEQVRFDPTTGMLDVSYAAAWQLGRLLALHDLAFASALYRWKLTQTQEAIAELEKEIVDSQLPGGAGGLAQAVKAVLRPALDQLSQATGEEA